MSWKLAAERAEFGRIECVSAAFQDITDMSLTRLPDREEKAT